MLVELQKIEFPKENICEIEEMYYRKIGVPAPGEILRDTILFRKGQRIKFDTYYNSLSLLKWCKYTIAGNFSLRIQLKGKFNIELIHMWLAPGGRLLYNVIAKHLVVAENKKEFVFEYNTENPFGMLTFSLTALENNSMFYSAAYITEIEKPLRNVKLGIGICTFKRESYVINNAKNIQHYILTNIESPLRNKLEIFISDNAQTLNLEDFPNEHFHVVKNKNTGGSGGFTRCMIEAINYNKENEDSLTHLVLMDDDIVFDPTSLERTYAILTLLKDEYIEAFVGGAMCRIDKQNIQHASGEFWHGDRCENFIESYNHNRNLLDLVNILENENFVDSNHQGWWFCSVPMKFIREDNLSLPFFIKSDDIEFSIRNMKYHILLNGINVWHESFESKYSAQNEYYTIRNYLISAAAHHQPVTKEQILQMLYNYTKHYICNYKYLEIEHFCNAINDFLRGVDYFKTIDLENYHKSILSKGYKMVDVQTLPIKFTKDQYYKDIGFSQQLSRIKRKFRKLTVNGLLLPARGFAVLGMWGGSNEQTYRKKFLVRYEVNTEKGFILYRSLKKALKSYKLYKKTKRNLIKNFNKAYSDFEARWKELVTLENWSRYL